MPVTPESLRRYSCRVQGQSPDHPLPTSTETFEHLRAAADEIERLDREYVATSDDIMTAQATVARLTAQAEALAEALKACASLTRNQHLSLDTVRPAGEKVQEIARAALADYREGRK